MKGNYLSPGNLFLKKGMCPGGKRNHNYIVILSVKNFMLKN